MPPHKRHHLHDISLEEFAPAGTNRGAGFALQTADGRYAFSVSGPRSKAPKGTLYLGGIGGHAEPGEDLIAAAKREAMEEIHARVRIVTAARTWHISPKGVIQQVMVRDEPRPLLLLGREDPGKKDYQKVIYRAELYPSDQLIVPDMEEVRALVALHVYDLLQLKHATSLGALRKNGALFLPGKLRGIKGDTRVEARGVARAISDILRHCAKAQKRRAAEGQAAA